MILETVRIVADWLGNGTYGLNAVRLAVPKDTDVTDFPAVTIIDSTRDGRVTRGGVPNLPLTLFPAVLVTPADQPVSQASPAVRPFPSDATVTVAVRYATREIDTAKAERDASQTIKAMWLQIPQLLLTAEGEAARTRAKVQMLGITDIQAEQFYESANDIIVTGGVMVTCRVRILGLD